MCGLAGIIGTDVEAMRAALPRMLAAQFHRGPDGGGEFFAPMDQASQVWLGLGHRRLSIIDRSDAGAQPMVHPRTGAVLIFNGEIYNFQRLRAELAEQGSVFRGGSDSEVLLEALVRWGPACIARLQGMFAFAFYRPDSRELILARDPLGIKPLYLGEGPGILVFASEVRAIERSGLIPSEIDLRGVAGLLSYGAVQHPFTLCRSIRSFQPGSWQVLRPGDINRRQTGYWSTPAPDAGIDADDVPGALRTTFETAVRDHLVSDVPIGLFLSSGLDSSILAATAARVSPTLRCFTVGFADDPDLSEMTMAAETAQALGLPHTQCLIDGAQALDMTLSWLGSQDQISVDGLNVYVVSGAVRSQGITVALSGQGGDELFGGYSSFSDIARLRTCLNALSWVPSFLRGGMARIAMAGRADTLREKAVAMARCDGDILDLYTLRRRMLSAAAMQRLGFDADMLGLTADYLDPDEAAELPVRDEDVVWSVSALEGRLYMGNMLLRDGDANSMAHSIELRVPFLDQRMLDLVFSLPGSVRLPEGRANKHLLRVTFADLLRSAQLDGPKRGFTLPIRRWMLGPLAELCRAGLEGLKDSGLVRPRAVDEIWSSFLRAPEGAAWTRAFTLCLLGHRLSGMAASSAMPAERLAS